MALPKTKRPIKPKKLKRELFSKSWSRGATKSWKLDFIDGKEFKKDKLQKDDLKE